MEDAILKSAKQAEDGKMEPVKTEITSTSQEEKKVAPASSSSDQEKKIASTSSSSGQEKKNALPSSSDQDLDVFLLGDLGDSDEGPGTVP